MSTAALAYEEPGIVTILILSSFLLLLNVVNWFLDHAIFCGLLGQVFIGIAWGLPGANWLSLDVQESILQFGYLGLILIVYEGGLSTSFASLWSNIHLSALVALIGVTSPIALSFVLMKLLDATPVQAFAAGAALCSTSLGTTFTILTTSGLDNSRLGVILSSAAMLDDIAGLVMTQVISNLGTSAGSFKAVTVIRPVFVSIAFATIVPCVCRLLVQPLTRHILTTDKYRELAILRLTANSASAFVCHTLILIAFVTGSSYAGTSNLFAAYIAGAVISWWDTLASDIMTSTKPASDSDQETNPSSSSMSRHTPRTGMAIYEQFYAAPLNIILKPFFFASIGFSIPITEMFHAAIVWRGIVYTTLMILGKLVCGLVLVRFTFPALPALSLPKGLPNGPTEVAAALGDADTASKEVPGDPAVVTSLLDDAGTVSKGTSDNADTDGEPNEAANTCPKRQTNATDPPTITPPHRERSLPKPQSLYPAAMLGSAMVARGEIGFLISSLAESTGVFTSKDSSSGQSSSSSATTTYSGSSEIFLVVTWAILLCTVIGPLSVGVMVKRVRRLQVAEREGGSGRVDPLGVWGVI